MTETLEVLTEQQAREIAQQRRTLEQAIDFAQENLTASQAALNSAAAAAADITNTGALKRLSAAQAYVRERTRELAVAKATLNKFNRTNPTDEDIRETERQAATERRLSAIAAEEAPLRQGIAEARVMLGDLLDKIAANERLKDQLSPVAFSDRYALNPLVDLLETYQRCHTNSAGDELQTIDQALRKLGISVPQQS